MTAAELRELRERRDWSQSDLSKALNLALGRNYGTGSISNWETGKRPIPKHVSTFLDELVMADALEASANGSGPPFIEPSYEPPDDERQPAETTPSVAEDVAPGAPQQALVSQRSLYEKACIELWEMIAAGVGMVGAATGSQALVLDGQIILGDREALGRAWGKLAETNDTFRKLLVSMTEGGAWLQVALATGTTVSKCWQSHQLLAAEKRRSEAGGGNDVGLSAVA